VGSLQYSVLLIFPAVWINEAFVVLVAQYAFMDCGCISVKFARNLQLLGDVCKALQAYNIYYSMFA